jgi:hypothetical protein
MSPATWPSLVGNLLAVTLHAQTPERFTRDVLQAQQDATEGYTNEDLCASAGNRPPPRAAGAQWAAGPGRRQLEPCMPLLTCWSGVTTSFAPAQTEPKPLLRRLMSNRPPICSTSSS